MDFSSNLVEGVFTANITPLKGDLAVDYDRLYSHIKYLLNNGSDGIALLGTTGEANSFSISERLDLIDDVFNRGFNPDRFIVGTGCCAIADTVRLTKQAVSHEAGGILMLPPFYYKQVTDQGLLDYFSRVVEGISDKRLKIYLYHFPKMSGVFLSNELISKLIEKYPGTFVGMKDSSGDFEHMKSIMQDFPGFKLYAGTEQYLQDVLNIGGAGCISASANVTSKIAAEVLTNISNPDQAVILQDKLSKARKAFEGLSFVAAVKQYFARYYDDPTYTNMRPPNTPISEELIDQLMENLNSLDLPK